MLAALLTALSAYIIRILLVREFGLEGVGIWQAAFLLSAVLVNFVLSAMGTDYYPRLSAVAHDAGRVRDSVNTQTEIALLLAVPGLMATIIFEPFRTDPRNHIERVRNERSHTDETISFSETFDFVFAVKCIPGAGGLG